MEREGWICGGERCMQITSNSTHVLRCCGGSHCFSLIKPNKTGWHLDQVNKTLDSTQEKKKKKPSEISFGFGPSRVSTPGGIK